MRAELEAVAPYDALDFALGCLRVSIEERIAVMNLPLQLAHGAILTVCAFLALMGFANGVAQFANDASVGIALVAIGLLWSAAFAAALAGTRQLLTRLAGGGITYYLALGLAGWLELPAFVRNRAMFEALAIEGVLLFAGLLALSSVAMIWPASNRTA